MEWVQIIVRGRRPKTEQWPLAPGSQQEPPANVHNSVRLGVAVRRGGQRHGRRSVHCLDGASTKCHVCRQR